MKAHARSNRVPHLVAAIALACTSLTATADVRDAEDKCVRAMLAADQDMSGVYKAAQQRTGQAVVNDDMELIDDTDRILRPVRTVCSAAKEQATDSDKVLIDEAVSNLFSYLNLYGVPGNSYSRNEWLEAVRKLRSEGGH